MICQQVHNPYFTKFNKAFTVCTSKSCNLKLFLTKSTHAADHYSTPPQQLSATKVFLLVLMVTPTVKTISAVHCATAELPFITEGISYTEGTSLKRCWRADVNVHHRRLLLRCSFWRVAVQEIPH